MHLKKLEIQGFKSFPEYTLVEFDRGMTAVVGPNGSGKSNVTDAIRWVLGEQSVKSLRGGKMEDVIFNGTQSRKAMNYAEVSMTLDNSDRYLDYDFNEIQITRRLYRSGESEYQINHVNCRLKDVTGLFLDTGLGKDGYSIVGQGRVDEILSPKSEDRRRVLEEASGIVKFKVRKEEAERKLNSTEQNLIRIDDILKELSERIEPLKDQSEKAIKYHRAYEELKQKDVSMLVYKIDKANEAMGDSASIKEQLEADLKMNEDRYMEMRSSNAELTSKAETLEDDIEEKRQELSDITEELHEALTEVKVSTDRQKQLELRIDTASSDEESISKDIERLNFEYLAKMNEADGLLLKANEEKKNADKLSFERDELFSGVQSSEKNIDGLRKQIEDKTNELIDSKDQINQLDSRLKVLDEKISDLSQSRQSSLEIVEQLDKSIVTADGAWHEMISKEGEAASDRQAVEESLKEIKKQRDVKLAEFETENKKLMTVKARLNALNELEKRKEGYQESVRRLLNECDLNPSAKKKVVGVLGDLISVKPRFETAIEIALGSSIHNVVTRTESDASDLISLLKQKRLGRVTFLPIENIRARRIEADVLSNARRMPGFIDVASNLTENDRELDEIIGNLLGKIIICDNMDNARAIASKIRYSVKIITEDGDSINPGGSLTGGSIRKDSAGILGRSREIAELEAKRDESERILGVSEAERQQLDEKYHDCSKGIDDIDERIKFFGLERVKAETEYNNLKNRKAEILKANAITEDSLKAFSKERLTVLDDIEEARLVISETENDLNDLRENIVAHDNESKDFSEKLEEMRERAANSAAHVEKLITERNGILNMASILNREKAGFEESLAKRVSEREADISLRDELKTKIDSFTELLNSLKEKSKIKEDEIKALAEQKNELEKSLSGFIGRLTDCSDTINSIKTRLNTLVTKYERYIEDIDTSKNRLWEDYELTYDNSKALCISIENPTDVGKEISSLRTEIKNIGPVNLNSIEEYKEVSERFEFMTSQRNDIAEAKSNLEKVISDLVDEMKTQFIAQFETINENFKKVFVDLFNGGTAEISLENDDVLNCAIDIKAQPPGKKLQSLTLLSGGERCLTAIAILFAILQLRPSPFVILDEVEAALDDVNVTRFTDFVRRYTAKSQFIVVTHRKGTMEACDRMYGVTMQERGISKILSMRLGN